MVRVGKSVFFSVVAILFTLQIVGCGSGHDGVHEPGQIDKEVDIHLLESERELPSKIRLFFKVDLPSGEEFSSVDPPDFEILENNSQISALESQLQIKREPGDFIYSSVLMLDLSGSILNNEDLSRLKEGAISFIEQTMPEEGVLHGTREMAVYWFDGEEDVHRLVDFTIDRSALLEGVESIDEDISDDDSTNLNGAVVKGLSLLDNRLTQISSGSDTAVAGSMILFTDGTDQAAIVSTSEALEAVDNTTLEHSVFTIGLGGEIDQTMLSAFGKDGFELAENYEELKRSFLAVADRLERESSSYYVLEYCSPKRAGQHNLQVRAVYEDQFGSFTTSFSAEGFTGGCQVQ